MSSNLTREEEYEKLLHEKEQELELPVDFLKNIYSVESKYLHVTIRKDAQTEIRKYIVDSIPESEEELEKFLDSEKNIEIENGD